MARVGPHALPAFFAVTFALLSLVVAGRRLWRRRRRTHPAYFHPMLRTTPSALELLPGMGDDETPAPAFPTTGERNSPHDSRTRRLGWRHPPRVCLWHAEGWVDEDNPACSQWTPYLKASNGGSGLTLTKRTNRGW